jgi:hypothetical protein
MDSLGMGADLATEQAREGRWSPNSADLLNNWWSMAPLQRVNHAATPSGQRVIIRADPSDVPLGVLSGITLLYRHARRRLRRDQSWTLQVRDYDEDPFGPVVYSEQVASRSEVATAIERLANTIRSTGVPGGS